MGNKSLNQALETKYLGFLNKNDLSNKWDNNYV